MSRADIEVLRSRFGALVGGAQAAVAYGELLAVEDAQVDLYLSRAASVAMSAMVALVDDPLGAVSLRVVDDDSWAVVDGSSSEIAGVAPRGAVVLDLLESGDPRHWIAAEHLAGVG
jgi:hypothetical protein